MVTGSDLDTDPCIAFQICIWVGHESDPSLTCYNLRLITNATMFKKEFVGD